MIIIFWDEHGQLKADPKFFWWALSKMGVVNLVKGLKNEQME